VLRLHGFEVEHRHGPIGNQADRTGPAANGVLLRFGTDDFDGALRRR